MEANQTHSKYNYIASLAQDAVDHIDPESASLAVEEVNSLLASPESKNLDAQVIRELQKMKTAAQIVNFPALSDIEAHDIIKDHLLEFFSYAVSLNDRIIARYDFWGYAYKNNVRNILKGAFFENKQLLGNITISEWLSRFEKRFPLEQRSQNVILNFITEDKDIQNLSEKQRFILKSVLNTYVSLIASELMDKYDISETLKEITKMEGGNYNQTEHLSFQTPEIYGFKKEITDTSDQKEKALSISDALKQYPELAEQVITSNKIKMKYFNEPIRPSIKNWLSDYTANLGYSNHTSMERGNYLFQSENTRNLGFFDRQRLSQVLKSFDEGTPVTVDLNTKQIVFSESVPEKKPGASSISNFQFPISNKIPNPNDQKTPASEINYNFPAKAREYGFQSDYQPKTQEPGNNFEKVIQLEDKEDTSPIFNAPRIVNLKEPAGEKPAAPAVPAPQPKNLLNIKEMVRPHTKNFPDYPVSEHIVQTNNPVFGVGVNRKEREESTVDLHKFAGPASPDKGYFQNVTETPVQREIKETVPENNIQSENNFVHPHTAEPRSILHASMDETEKSLFQKNNDLESHNMQFSHAQKMPFEKKQEKIEKIPEIPDKPAAPEPPKAQPYRIHPSDF
jgi:hypothetical protein